MPNVNVVELNIQQQPTMKRETSVSRFKVEKVERPADSVREPERNLAEVEDCYDEPIQTPPLEEIYSKRSKQVQFTVGATTQDNISHTESSAFDRRQSYGTTNAISFRNMQTVEKVPHIDHYRDMHSVEKAIASRPTLAELHDGDLDEHHDEEEKLQSFIATPEQGGSAPVKLGWIQGVLVRCILCILGVMLYLRLSWVSAQAGVGFGCLIVLLGTTVTTLTALSLCAISTNGEVKGGGAYFLLSRSLGPEFGGSIGIIFSFANAVAAAMYMVGFAESVRDLMKEHSAKIFDGSTNDIRLVALCTAVLLLGVVMVGVQFETKAQLVLLFVLLISIVSFVIGTVIPPTEFKQARGVTGYSWVTMSSNFLPDWRSGESFFSVFAVYFPAATGIMAGANISGDLADPQKSIPKGTLLAILITTIIYVGGVTLTGATCLRDASGNLTDLYNDSISDCAISRNCSFGLHNYFQVIELESVFSPLVTAGVFAATLSSALASLVSAPKIFQAVCKDRLFPYITYFAKGFGRSDEPRPGYFLSFFIACSVICIGDLNAIAPIISNFFLASYALINYACFDASFAKSPGFRPAFKYYNMWLSLFGAIVCMAVMFLISWWTALITYACILALYVWLLRRKPEVNWGSSSQAHAYRNALNSMLRLSNIEEHVKNYRPQILVLSGNPIARSLIIDFAANITKDTSLLICGHVIVHSNPDRLHNTMQKLSSQMNNWLQKRHTRAFYVPLAAQSLDDGAHHLLQVQYPICSYAFDHMLAVGVLRLSKGLDFGVLFKQPVLEESKSQLGLNAYESATQLSRCPSYAALGGHAINPPTDQSFSPLHQLNGRPTDNLNLTLPANLGQQQQSSFSSIPNTPLYPSPLNAVTITVEASKKNSNIMPAYNIVINEADSQATPEPVTEELLTYINQFQHKVKKGIIDVFWLFDDGGLSLLIPHILTQSKSSFEGSKLRVFTIASSRHQLEQEQRSMAALLSKFRIDYADVYVIPDITGKPKPESIKEFDNLIQPLLEASYVNDNNNSPGKISDAELLAQKDRTYRQIRIRELLLKHSLESSLIVLTMPIPRRSVCSSALYMAWLDTLSRDLPPVLLMRGNQQSVLTFYS